MTGKNMDKPLMPHIKASRVYDLLKYLNGENDRFDYEKVDAIEVYWLAKENMIDYANKDTLGILNFRRERLADMISREEDAKDNNDLEQEINRFKDSPGIGSYKANLTDYGLEVLRTMDSYSGLDTMDYFDFKNKSPLKSDEDE